MTVIVKLVVAVVLLEELAFITFRKQFWKSESIQQKIRYNNDIYEIENRISKKGDIQAYH